jgi:protein-disulfide isomerase
MELDMQHRRIRTVLVVTPLLLSLAALSPSGRSLAQDGAAGAAAKRPAASGDVDQMRGDIDALKKGQEDIQKSLAEIKSLLQQNAAARPAAPPAVPNVTLDLKGHTIQGAREAKLTLVEISDYQCPYCARHTRETYPLIEKDFIATGKLRYAMVDYPLRNHPFSFKAAEAATCAEGKGKFWEMHDLLFQNQNALNPETLPAYAELIGIDRGEFEACLKEGRQDSVNADLQQATRAGVSATPTFLIGWLADGDQLKPVDVIRGAVPYDNFAQVINKLLQQGPPQAAGGGR